VFLAMRHMANFVAASVLSSFAANAATGLFLIVDGVLPRSTPPWRSLGVAVLAWLAASLAAQQVAWRPLTALLLNLTIYGAGFALPNLARIAAPDSAPSARRRWFDLPVRAMAVAAFVSFVVTATSALGPNATGIAAVFPISLIGLTVIVRPRIGRLASSLLAANAPGRWWDSARCRWPCTSLVGRLAPARRTAAAWLAWDQAPGISSGTSSPDS